MQVHQIKRVYQLKSKKRIGRGGKRGTYSGKGQKGQKSRAGANIRSEQRAAILKIPKRRGVKFKNNPRRIKNLALTVNLNLIERVFKNGEAVNPKVLLSRGLVKSLPGKVPAVKILSGNGVFSKKLYFSGVEFSQKAKELVVKAGSQIK